VLEARAEALLLALESIVRRRVAVARVRGGDRTGWRRQAELLGAVETLEALGLLRRRDAAAWRRRFDSVATASVSPNPAVVEPWLRARLDAVIREELRIGGRQRGPSERQVTLVEAACDLGLLPWGWGAPLRVAAQPDGPGRVPPAFRAGSNPTLPAGAASAELRDVLVPAGPPGHLSCVELYGDAVLVRIHSPELRRRASTLRLSDDVGTTYRPHSGSSWSLWFQPAVPADAGVLWVSLDGDAIELPLRGAGRDAPSPTEVVDDHVALGCAALIRYGRDWDMRSSLRQRADRDLAKVELLRRLTVLDADATSQWQARLAALKRDAARSREGRELRALCRDYLDARATAAEGGGTPSKLRFAGALVAVASLGLLTERERLRWLRALSSDDGEPWPHQADEVPFHDSSLERVVAGPGTRIAGYRISAVELLPSGVVARWHHDPATTSRRNRLPLWPLLLESFGYEQRPSLALTDDAGTRYYPQRSEWANYGYDVDGLAVGSASFKPAPPPRARWLTVRSGGEALRVALRP
jgi:hypothetical protein